MEAIELYSRMQDPLAAVEKLGVFFAKSGMFGCEKVEQGAILALACMAEKKSPLEITKRYHLLDGRLSMKSEAMLAEFHAAKGKHKIVTRTPDCAAIELTIDGQTQIFTLTWAEAQAEPFPYGKEKQLKKNWATPRARMQTMWARVVSDGVRAMAPEIVTGTYTPEEIEDFEPTGAPKQVFTPTEEKKTKVATPAPAAPVATPTPPPTVEPAVPTPPTVDAEIVGEMVTKAEAGSTGTLTAATIFTLQTIIGEKNWAKALEWLKAKNQIKEDINTLTLPFAQRIIDAPDKFIGVIGGTK